MIDPGDVLAWGAVRLRDLPWRAERDPWRILVAEVMLQQTQAPRVVPAYEGFLRRFPSVRALARAPRREVLLAWDGLGYNRRAIALSEAARVVASEHREAIPSDTAALQRLPGVGPYTAAAVASIAFGAPVAAIDTNVRRVVARVLGGAEGHELPPARVRALVGSWLDPEDPGAWNQALMDLGREACRPRPRCGECPLLRWCRFAASGRAPSPRQRSQVRFEGSLRQIRGAVVGDLRARASADVDDLATAIGADPERVREAIRRLATDGVITVRGGRVRLAD